MSEADVIREAIGTDLGEYEIQEPLASLDSLTTRLAEVERERDRIAQRIVEADEQDALRERLAEVERENDLVRHENHEARTQLTQAREALEQLRGDGICIEPLTNPPCGFRFVATGETQPIRPNHPKCIARQALATINEGETA